MKALRISAPGGAENLVYEDTPEPETPTGEVLVAVRACGFTPNELTWPSTYADRAGRDRTPSVVGHEVSGVVVATGFGTTGVDVGDEVFGLVDPYRDGAAADLVSVDVRNVAPKPDAIDDAVAASLAQSALTAWQALFVHGRLAAGQTVMVHGAAGAVGGIAVQMARHAGARVVGTGKAGAEAHALEAGADAFVDVGRDDLGATGPVDLVIDTIGGDVLARSPVAVRPGGTIVSIVVPPPPVPGGRSMLFVVEPDRRQLTEIAALVVDGTLRPNVSVTYAIADGRRAFPDKQRGLPGKAVLVP